MAFEVDKELKESDCNMIGGEFSKMQQLISDLTSEFEAKKQEILKEKVKELGIEIDWELEAKRRFKSIMHEYHTDTREDIYFYNDGSVEGQRIVTFAPSEIKDSGANITMGFHHY